MNEKKVKKIKKSIVIKIVDLEKVHPNAFNYNRQTNFIFDKQKASIRKYGFIEPIICRDDPENEGAFEIVNGEHRYLALLEMFMANEVVYLDMAHKVELKRSHIPIHNLGSISREEAQQLCIALNEIKGRPDNDALAENLAELHKGGLDLSALPYTEVEIESYMRLVDDDLDFDTEDGSIAEEGEATEDAGLTDGDDIDKEDVFDDKSVSLLITALSLDNLTKEEAEGLYTKFIAYLKSNKILRSEGHKGVLKIFEEI